MLTNYTAKQGQGAGHAAGVAAGPGPGSGSDGSVAPGSGQSLLQWNEPMKPIGYLRSCFVRKNGTPRQGGLSPTARASLTLTCFDTPAPALHTLEEFSHVWVLFIFHQNGKATAKPKVAPPRLGGDTRVGTRTCAPTVRGPFRATVGGPRRAEPAGRRRVAPGRAGEPARQLIPTPSHVHVHTHPLHPPSDRCLQHAVATPAQPDRHQPGPGRVGGGRHGPHHGAGYCRRHPHP